MISTRFAFPVVVILTLALVPTVIHRYVGLTIDDGHRAAAVGWTLAGLRGARTSRSAATIRDAYDSVDWIERRFTGAEGQVTVFVARSFDAKRLYHHPEHSILHGTPLASRGTRRLRQMPEVPVHMLASETQGAGFAVYALLYDDRFIDSPYLFQVRASWDTLIGGRKPMTLFLVYDASQPPEASVENRLAVRVLHEAIRQFLAQRAASAS